MTIADVKHYRLLTQEVDYYETRIRELRIRIESPRIPELTGQPGAKYPSGSGSQQERLADIYMDSCREYEEKLKATQEQLRRIEAAVDRLPTKERMVTRWHCFEKMPYKIIADMMELSISSVSMIQISAYKMLEEMEE